MAEARLTKFIADQEAAVDIARSAMDTPQAYNIRVDAINGALSLAQANHETVSVNELLANARRIEAYLKGGA